MVPIPPTVAATPVDEDSLDERPLPDGQSDLSARATRSDISLPDTRRDERENDAQLEQAIQEAATPEHLNETPPAQVAVGTQDLNQPEATEDGSRGSIGGLRTTGGQENQRRRSLSETQNRQSLQEVVHPVRRIREGYRRMKVHLNMFQRRNSSSKAFHTCRVPTRLEELHSTMSRHRRF